MKISSVVPGRAKVADDILLLKYIVMAGSNGFLYIWAVHFENEESAVGKIGVSAAISKCLFLGSVELPVKMQFAVSIVQVENSENSDLQNPRIAVLSAEGHLTLLDIEGLCKGSVGTWTVVADLKTEKILGEYGTNALSDSKYKLRESIDFFQKNQSQPCISYSCNCKFVAHKEYLAVVGLDGAIRILNS